MNALGRDVLDFGFGMDAVSNDAGLRASERGGGDVESMEGDGGERGGGLFTGGEQHVHLALVGQRHEIFGELDQAVGNAAHGGNDDDDLIAFGVVLGDASGDVSDAVGVCDRGAAVFLDDQHIVRRPY